MRDWLSHAAATRPDHPYLVAPDGQASFAETDQRVARAAGALRRAGLGPGTRVAVWADNTVPSVVALLAVPRAGAELVLVNTRLTAGEAAAQLRAAGAATVLGPKGLADLGVPRVPFDRLDEPPLPAPEPDPAATHTIAFTSGSSGRPRGVRLTWANLEASAAASARHLDHRPDDRWLAVLPVFHVGGLQILIRSARQATTVLLEPRFDPARAAALLRDGDATLASMVAAMLRRVLDADPGPYRGVRAVLVGGGPFPRELGEEAADAGLPVLPTYGMTETASQVATAPLDEGLHPRARAVPVPGAELRIASDGMIEVRGPMVSPGYLGEPDRPPGSWLRTGDLGELDPEGGLTVIGRADDVIVTGGENVHPAEVEAALRSHPDVDEVAVVGVPDPTWGTVVTAVYTGAASPGSMERHARYRLAGYKIPRRWVQVAELPRLSIGKVDRAAAQRMAAPE